MFRIVIASRILVRQSIEIASVVNNTPSQ